MTARVAGPACVGGHRGVGVLVSPSRPSARPCRLPLAIVGSWSSTGSTCRRPRHAGRRRRRRGRCRLRGRHCTDRRATEGGTSRGLSLGFLVVTTAHRPGSTSVTEAPTSWVTVRPCCSPTPGRGASPFRRACTPWPCSPSRWPRSPSPSYAGHRGRRSLVPGTAPIPTTGSWPGGGPASAASGAYVGVEVMVVAAGSSVAVHHHSLSAGRRDRLAAAGPCSVAPPLPGGDHPAGPTRDPDLPIAARGRTRGATHAPRGLRLQLDRPGGAGHRRLRTRAGPTGGGRRTRWPCPAGQRASTWLSFWSGSNPVTMCWSPPSPSSPAPPPSPTSVPAPCWSTAPRTTGPSTRPGRRGLGGPGPGRSAARAVVAVDLYGQRADYAGWAPCRRTRYRWWRTPPRRSAPPTAAAPPAPSASAVFSFNGNKIITTGGGGMLVPVRPTWRTGLVFWPRRHASRSSTTSTRVGYNYRLTNLLAALGRAQLRGLDSRIQRRRRIDALYRQGLGTLPASPSCPSCPMANPTGG